MARARNKGTREWVAAAAPGTASHLAEEQSKCAWEHLGGHSDAQPCPSYIPVLPRGTAWHSHGVCCIGLCSGAHPPAQAATRSRNTPRGSNCGGRSQRTALGYSCRYPRRWNLQGPTSRVVRGEGPGAQALISLSWETLSGYFF